MSKSIFNNCGKNYSTRSEAEARKGRIEQDWKDIALERRLAGRGPLTSKMSWEVKGDEKHGYYVEETITKK